MVVSKFISLASQDKPLIVYMDGNQTRDFTFIEDVVKATVIVSSSNKTNSETFDVCTGVETRISNLAKIIKKGLNSQSKIVYKEFPMGRVNFEVTHRVGCVDKLTQLTRFVPLFDLNKGPIISKILPPSAEDNLYPNILKIKNNITIIIN